MTAATRTSGGRKDSAVAFLRLAAAGKTREAFGTFVSARFVHHNPFFRGNAASLAAGMAENARANPEKTLEIQHVLEDGDLVAVHSRVRMKPDDLGIAVIHLFRFSDGLIMELWDIAQPVPADAQNEQGMF